MNGVRAAMCIYMCHKYLKHLHITTLGDVFAVPSIKVVAAQALFAANAGCGAPQFNQFLALLLEFLQAQCEKS